MLKKEDAKDVIITKTKSKSTYKTWIFECIDCGKDIKVQTNGLKHRTGKCTRCSQLGTPYMFIYNELKNHRNMNVEFALKFEDLLYIIENNSKCHYCESELIYHKHSKVYGVNNSRAHHLDRKNNDIGYTKNNVVPCCWECNRLKSDRFTYDEFMKLSPMLIEIMNNRN